MRSFAFVPLGLGPKTMALIKGIWDPKRRVTHSKGTNLKSLMHPQGASTQIIHGAVRGYI